MLFPKCTNTLLISQRIEELNSLIKTAKFEKCLEIKLGVQAKISIKTNACPTNWVLKAMSDHLKTLLPELEAELKRLKDVVEASNKLLNEEHSTDPKEVSTYTEIKTGDRVLVSDNGNDWRNRYFSHVTDEGIPHTFYAGATSWSTEKTTSWAFCKKADNKRK